MHVCYVMAWSKLVQGRVIQVASGQVTDRKAGKHHLHLIVSQLSTSQEARLLLNVGVKTRCKLSPLLIAVPETHITCVQQQHLINEGVLQHDKLYSFICPESGVIGIVFIAVQSLHADLSQSVHAVIMEHATTDLLH